MHCFRGSLHLSYYFAAKLCTTFQGERILSLRQYILVYRISAQIRPQDRYCMLSRLIEELSNPIR